MQSIDETIQNSRLITTGEAIARMILNDLGFLNKPINLTPYFLENKALERACNFTPH
ncbi:MAG: DUF4277 domain-containing protein [Legionellales bacterium]|nr:DUF4277 domain-containing protein [Legionellales bacterium]